MKFQQKIKLLNNRDIWANEINFKQYKAIVKSNYSEDDSSFVYHTNLVLENNINKEDYLTLTVVDKALILLQLKAVSVGPDLKLKVKCEETEKEFEFTLPIDNLIKNFILNNSSKTIEFENFSIQSSIVKAKDEQRFIEPYVTNKDTETYFFHTVVSSIDSIRYKNKTVYFKDLSWEERVQLVTRLPSKLSSYIIKNIAEVEKDVSQNKLISVRSPYTNKITLEMPLTTNVPSLVKFIKLVFTENLSNLYTITYNLVNYGKFTGDYLDSITPIETQVYWIYCQKQMEKEGDQKDNSMEGANLRRRDSEFT